MIYSYVVMGDVVRLIAVWRPESAWIAPFNLCRGGADPATILVMPFGYRLNLIVIYDHVLSCRGK
jgi:hypothetical protein